MSETDIVTQADKNDMQSTRRHWFTAGLRWTAAALISAVSLRLLSRKPTEESCVDPHGHLSCRDCGALNGCSLPRALSLKQFLQKNDEKRES
jgi:hypothetical protein